MKIKLMKSLAFILVTLLSLSSCTPRVEVAVPDKPINININAKIDHEVKIKVEREVDDLFSEESELF